MRVTHELVVTGTCPVNGMRDRYEVTVEAERIVNVEDILAAVATLPAPIFQEDLTERLAAAIGCRVRTIGYHSGVRTTCECA